MISYVISLMKACLPVRAFAWKEVSTETLPDSCPDPLLFLLFSRRFPALSLLLGPLRFHQIEQLLFRVDLKLGIETPRMRRPGQHVLRALLRQPGLFRRPCPWLRRVRGQRHQRVSGTNPETWLIGQKVCLEALFSRRNTGTSFCGVIPPKQAPRPTSRASRGHRP